MWKRVLFLVGVLMVAFPLIVNRSSQKEYENVIKKYEEQAHKLDREQILQVDYSDVIGGSNRI